MAILYIPSHIPFAMADKCYHGAWQPAGDDGVGVDHVFRMASSVET